MNDTTTVLYALSTLAQTVAALAAFVGAVGLFRLQILRDGHREAELELRRASEGLQSRDVFAISMLEILRAMEKPDNANHPALPRANQARRNWEAFVPRFKRSRRALIVFEGWNLLVILGSLGGFAHVPLLASLRWSGALCWSVVLITVAVTGWGVFVWLGENGPMDQGGATHGGGSGWRQRSRQLGSWINRQGPWVTALASIAIAVVSLALARASNEGAYRAWLTVKHVRDVPPIIPGAHAELTAEIENTGRSPAQNVRVKAATAYQGRDWRIPDHVPEASESNVGVIGPMQIRSIDFRMKNALSQADVDAINNGTRRVYWFADVAYSDQFGSDRLLQFCFVYEPSKPNKSMVSFPTCGSHESVK